MIENKNEISVGVGDTISYKYGTHVRTSVIASIVSKEYDVFFIVYLPEEKDFLSVDAKDVFSVSKRKVLTTEEFVKDFYSKEQIKRETDHIMVEDIKHIINSKITDEAKIISVKSLLR